MLRRVGSLALGFLFLLLTVVPATAHASAPATTEDPAQALLERYKPSIAVRTHARPCGAGERYLPIAVDHVLGRADVVLRDAHGTVLQEAPTAADLADGPPDRWLDFPGNALTPGCSYEDWFRTMAARPVVYGRIAREDGVLVAQYWEFWVFNEWNDLHEGDWEMTQVMFRASSAAQALRGSPYRYADAQHEGAQYVDVATGTGATGTGTATSVNGVSLVGGTHPVVFAAQGSHASYFQSALWFGKSPATGVGCDNARGPLAVVEPDLVVLPAGNDPPTTGPFAWLSYRGRWGERQPAFANGPTGPYLKQQWAQPVTWVKDRGRDAGVRVPFASSPPATAFCRLTEYGSALFNQLLDRPAVVLVATALVLAALAVLLRRSSQGVLVRALRSSWRARRKLAPAVAIALIGVVVAYGAQRVFDELTPIGDLSDVVGDSSAWVTPVSVLAQAVVLVPILAWAATITLVSVRPAVVLAAEPPHPSPTLRSFWAVMTLTVVLALAVAVFWPLALVPTWWLVAPVVASRGPGSLRAAFGTSRRLVRQHWLRSLGLVVTVALIALLPAVAGGFVLLATALTFDQAGIVTGALLVVLVPYLTMVLVEFHADLWVAHGGEDDEVPAPRDAPSPVG